MQKRISFKNAQGQRLVGVLHMPAGHPAGGQSSSGSGRLPVVMVQHGFSGNFNDLLIKQIALRLERTGFAVLRFAFSGHRPSGGGYKKVLVSQFIRDLVAAINFLARQKQVDINKLGLVGHSMGGFTALMAANVLGKRLKAIVSISSYFDLDSLIAYYQKNHPVKVRDQYWQIGKFKISKRHFADRRYLKKRYLISMIKRPVLVIHGENDRTVKLRDASAIYQLLHQPKALRIIKQGDHNFNGNKQNQKLIANACQRWFRKYLL